MTPIRAILVDLDGTLADTAAANHAAYAAALAEHGVAVEQERFHALSFGRNWRQFLPVMLEEAGVGSDPAVIAARKAQLYAGMMDMVAINTPLVRLLQLNRALCRTALVTTASAANAGAILAHHGLVDLFDTIVTGSDVQRHKPDPQAYQLAAERLEVLPEDCLIFEDSDIGMASASAFGAQAIRVVLA
ncbi:HAD family phosphatase [Devosia sp. 1566]|uniref:HAD family hydrolase n=1 Tax=Devosia sp. 1566 TaxID=2499144 RepID=UPI000FDAAB8D|nr:HAD family phosphatase [Devosia sp. 1566]